MLEIMTLMRREAEDREDARQQRLLEHEARMEEKRQQWRQVELRHQETIAHMVLQGMERLGQLLIFAQQQKSSENVEELSTASGVRENLGGLDQSKQDLSGERSNDTEGCYQTESVGTSERGQASEEEKEEEVPCEE